MILLCMQETDADPWCQMDDRKAMRENTQWWLGCVFSCQCPSACNWKRLRYKCYRRHCGVECQRWISSSRNQCSPMRIRDREVKSRSVKEMAELKGMETHRQPAHFIHTNKFIFSEHFFKPKFKSNSFFLQLADCWMNWACRFWKITESDPKKMHLSTFQTAHCVGSGSRTVMI